MDLIGALRHHAPTASSLGAASAHSYSEAVDSCEYKTESAPTSSSGVASVCADADGVSGGLSHFLHAEGFFSRMRQLIESTQQLCRFSRTTRTVHGVRMSEQAVVPFHSNPLIGSQGAGEDQDSFAESHCPPGPGRSLARDGPEHLRIEHAVREVSASINDSVSAVVFCAATLEIYQSQPTLLDPYLSQIVKPLSEIVTSNLELLTPLSIPELQVELAKIISHSSCGQNEIVVPVDSNSVPTAAGSSASSSSSSSVSCFPSSSSWSSSSLPASASPFSALSFNGAVCDPSQSDYLRKSNDSKAVDQETSPFFAALHSKPAVTCINASGGSLPTTAGAESNSPPENREGAVVELEDLFLRTTASVALRLLLHLLYVLSRVRGYKSVRQLLPSEPDLLEVLVDHCEMLLTAEFVDPLHSAAATECLSGANLTAVTPSINGEQHSVDVITSSGATAQQGDLARKNKTDHNCVRRTEALLVQHMHSIIQLLQQLPLWSTHYSLLVWLSLLVLAPFDLESLDSSILLGSYCQQQIPRATMPPHQKTLAQGVEVQPAAPALQEKEETENNSKAAPTRGLRCSLRRKLPLRLRIIVLVESYLRNTSSKASDAAAFVVARFFGRPDVCTEAASTFSAFLQFCQEVLDGHGTCTVVGEGDFPGAVPSSCCHVSAVQHSASGSIPLFAKANVLRAVNEILKNISRASALPELPRLLHLVDIGGAPTSHEVAVAAARKTAAVSPPSVQHRTPGEASARATVGALSETASGSALFRKLRCSCAARICMLLLPPVHSGTYRWRYTQHARNLEAYLKQLYLQVPQQQQSQPQGSVPERQSVKREHTPDGSASNAIQGDELQDAAQEDDVPDAVEEVMGLLLDSLADRDTVVRWAAAKAVGRVVLQLPCSFARQVVASILDRMKDAPSYRTASEERLWHGSCLALGELLRRGLVDPSEHLAACADRLCCALTLDNSGGAQSCSHSAAAAAAEQLRDAACFAIWSVARAYHHTQALQQQIRPLSEALLLVALFDREVNCRRAAAAAFQELEGRQNGIPHGLQIVTTADFFALATRRSAYLKVAPQVAALDSSYCDLLLNTLVQLVVQQGDEEMRTLAAAAIKRIARLKERAAVERFMESLLQKAAAETENIPARHGALLALTAFIEALGILPSRREKGETATMRGTTLRRERTPPGGPGAGRETTASASTGRPSIATTHDHAKGRPTCGSHVRLCAEKTVTCSLTCSGGSGAPVEAAAAAGVACTLGEKLQTSLRQLVVHMEKQRLYRGKGGDMIRIGVCVFIQALATSKCINFKPATARRYIATLLEGLRHFSDSVQLAAAEALRALLCTRVPVEDVLQDVVPQLLQHLQNSSEHVAARRGYVLALATLPAEVYRRACSSSPRLDTNAHRHPDLLTVLQTEAVSLAPLGCPSLGDAQTRRNALIALAFALRALLTSPLQTVSAEEDGRKAAEGTPPGGEKDALPGGRHAVTRALTAIAGAPHGAESTAAAERCPPGGETAETCATSGGVSTRTAATPSTETTAAPCSTAGVDVSASAEDTAAAAQPSQLAGARSMAEGTAEVCRMAEEGSVGLFNASTLKQLCSTFEACSVDYQVDRRGDVGSWVREVAAEVVTFLLENLQMACPPTCRRCCADYAGPAGLRSDKQATRANTRQLPASEDRYTLEDGQTCTRARLLSILIRLSLESLDRTRSRAIFLLYHLLAPLPARFLGDGSPPLTPFKIEWIWSRVFYDYSYEAVSANLIPRLDLLRAGPSTCFLMNSWERTALFEAAMATAEEAPVPAGSKTAASPAKAATPTGCGLLVSVLQHALLPLAEKQANALESVKPCVPFHNLNLSEFAATENSFSAVSAARSSTIRTDDLAKGIATAQANDDFQRAADATPARGSGTAAGALDHTPAAEEQPLSCRVFDTNDGKSFSVEGGNQESLLVSMIPLCGRDAVSADGAAATNRVDTASWQQTSASKGAYSRVVKKRARHEGHAKGPPDTEERKIAEQLCSSFAGEGCFDFLLEASVGDGGRASLCRTRKAGVLLRLPLFTDSARTYPLMLLSLLMPPPFCQAAAQGLCLGVGSFSGRSSEKAAQAFLAFLTELRQAEGTGTGGATGDEGNERADVEQQGGRKKQQSRGLVAAPLPVALSRTTERQAAKNLLYNCGEMRPSWAKNTTVHRAVTLIVDVLEDSACALAEKACKGEARSDLHSGKTCLAALRTVTLISNFLSTRDRQRVLELVMKKLSDGVWRRSFQYAKARCEALITILAAETLSAPVSGHCDLTKKETNTSVEPLDSAATAPHSARTVHRKALCAALQYLTHSFLKLRQFAAEELYALLLLPLSETHVEASFNGALENASSTATDETARTTRRWDIRSEVCPPLVLTAPQVEQACQIVTGTPWMELSTRDTKAVDMLVCLFDVSMEWDAIRERGESER